MSSKNTSFQAAWRSIIGGAAFFSGIRGERSIRPRAGKAPQSVVQRGGQRYPGHLTCLAVLSGCVAFLLTTLAPGLWAQSADLPSRGICAHRGAMQTHPENTLAAFRETARVGAHMVELDVRLTKDGVPVVIHDATVDRTTNGTGRVADLTLAQIERLDAGSWKDPRFAGERVPTLRQALDSMPLNMWVNLNLKEGAELGRAVAPVVAEADRLHQAFLAGPREAAEAARAVEPRILICNLDRQRGSEKYIEETITMKAAFVQLLRGQRGHEGYPDFVRRLKSHRVRITYCCTDDSELLRALFAEGVDFPLVDHVQAAVKIAQEVGIEPLRPVYRTSGEKIGDRDEMRRLAHLEQR